MSNPNIHNHIATTHIELISTPYEKNQLTENIKKFQLSVSNMYNMETEQFKKFSQFFNAKSEDGQFINIDLVKKLMNICIKNKKMVQATEQNIENALEQIKTYDY